MAGVHGPAYFGRGEGARWYEEQRPLQQKRPLQQIATMQMIPISRLHGNMPRFGQIQITTAGISTSLI
jgi:hypothetical protein